MMFNPSEPYYRPSRETRPLDPEAAGEVHPRAAEMASTVLDLQALGQGVSFRDLVRAGFSSAEIIEHHAAAEKLANEAGVKQLCFRPDRLEDIIDKARAPMPNRPPLPRDASETQALTLAWGRYCAARAAFTLDPWSSQRERCLAVLSAYLDRLPIFARSRDAVLKAVEATLPMVTQ